MGGARALGSPTPRHRSHCLPLVVGVVAREGSVRPGKEERATERKKSSCSSVIRATELIRSPASALPISLSSARSRCVGHGGGPSVERGAALAVEGGKENWGHHRK